MKKVLIAVTQKEAAMELKLFLQNNGYEIAGIVSTGEDAVKTVTASRPDVVVMDLLLPNGDGFSVLSAIRACGKGTRSIVLSPMSSEDVVARAMNAGADYYIVKPCRAESVKSALDALVGEKTAKVQREFTESSLRAVGSVDERISNIFLAIGIPPHIKGYGYLREGVKMAIDRPDIINGITKELYPKIGEKFNTTASKVERAIRHAIEVAWNRGRIETINALFGVRAYVGQEKPTNGEFIALVADKMLLERA